VATGLAVPSGVPPLPAGGSPTSSRKPYPYHATLQVRDGPVHGLMLTDGIVAKRVLPMANYQAPVQEEETGDLYRERSYSFRRLYLGLGDASQQSNGPPARYFYAKNAWHAGALRGLGPRFRQLSLAAAEGEVAGAVEAIHVVATAPVTRLFVLAGRYVRRWDGPTGGEQALSLDLGAGVVARSWARWTAGGPGEQDALYLTDSARRLWRYQSGAWTDLTAGGAPQADYVCATGVELWRVAGTTDQPAVAFAVSKCEGNPLIPANWTASIEVGDASVPVTGLAEMPGAMSLRVFKADGTVWALQGGADVGTARCLTPDLRESQSGENGKRPAGWLGGLFFRAGDSLWQLTQNGAERVGPERLVDNTSPVRGPVGAFAGFGAWYGLGALYNATTATSHLLQYGNWVPAEQTSPQEGAQRFLPAWEGSLLDLPGKRVTALAVTSHEQVVGVPPDGGNPLLLVGFSDGTYGWLRLPRDGPSPFTKDAHLAPDDFTDQESFTRHPRHSLMAPGDLKAYLSFAATGPVLDEWRAVEVQYRIDPVGDETPWTPLFDRLTQAGGRVMFPDDTSGRTIDVREHYRATTPPPEATAAALARGVTREEHAARALDFAALATPVLATLTLREQLRPAFRLEYQMTISAHDRVARRDGASDRKTPQQVYDLVVAAAQEPGHVILTLSDETVGRFAMIEFGLRLGPDGRFRRRGAAWEIPFTAVTYRTVSPYGRWFRWFGATWDDADGDTWDDTDDL
jgi:hypothetical protein